MRKSIILVLLIAGFMCAGNLAAMNFNETLSQHDTSDEVVETEDTSQARADLSGTSASDEDLPDYGYVRVNTSLNVRTGPWGTIIGSLYNNDKVRIIGREGNWYKIEHNGGVAYVHSWYVSQQKGAGTESSPSNTGGAPFVNVPAKGSVQQKVVSAAQDLVNRYDSYQAFPYDSLTKGGRLGCAQVVTTALEAAGVNTGIQLGVLNAIDRLRGLGWQEVSVPPYQSGDVITWRTYDRSGNGRNDNDTHIGIIMNSGNNVQAMSNSSSRRMPRVHPATYAPVCRVLRKV
ncbi:MAG: SH3 domain-containing protein [Candidatus Rifleibacteriota bacterium]